MKRTVAELNITAEVRMNPGRIYGRRSGRKFFQSKGVQEDCSGTQLTVEVRMNPGRIYGRRSGRKFFQIRGFRRTVAELN